MIYILHLNASDSNWFKRGKSFVLNSENFVNGAVKDMSVISETYPEATDVWRRGEKEPKERKKDWRKEEIVTLKRSKL